MTHRSLARALIVPLLLGVLCLGFGSSPVRVSAVSAGAIQGDVNCSGAADAADSLQILVRVANSAANVTGCGDSAGDVDCDGDQDVDDAMRILRFAASLPVDELTNCVEIGAYLVAPPTSGELIAAALEAGDITYEQSLLYRAYALFADPRLPAEYQSPVRDWEAGTELFGEIDANEGQISAEVLADLQPFLVRPNDPASIHYDTPELAEAAPQGVSRAWRTSLVAGTNARVWALGTAGAEQKYVPLMAAVWPLVVKYMGTPNPDQAGDPNAVVNPDAAIDFYFVNPGIDPRNHQCEVNPNPASCLSASDDGMARRAAKFVGNTASGYLMVNAGNINGDPLQDDNLVDTIAHEMAHVSQYKYDTGETSWLYESTATWVAYRAMLDLGREPEYAHNRARDLYNVLDKPLTDLQGNKPKYRSWLFFQHAAMATGDDGIVKKVWDKAKTAGANGINAVNEAYPLEDNFEDFAVRNWNKKPPLQSEYRDADILFPHFAPDATEVSVSGESDFTLDKPVEPLSAQYYHYTFGDNVRYVIFENNLVATPHAHVWLLKKISGDWKPPENMEGAAVETWCRDATTFDENLEELVVVVSNSEIASDQPGATPPPALSHPNPRVIADQIACRFVIGTVRTTLHVKNDGEDITYTSNDVPIYFKPRDIQPEPGDIYYDVSKVSGHVIWKVTGTVGGCPADGEAAAIFPGGEFTGVEPDAGYLVVVAPGDNHSAIVNAYPPVGTTYTVTCPGDPPSVFEEPFEAGLLLHVLGWPNSSNGTEFKGNCTLKLGDLTWEFTWNLGGAGPSSSSSAEAVPDLGDCVPPPPCPPVCSIAQRDAILESTMATRSSSRN
jgi:hypothetical protein